MYSAGVYSLRHIVSLHVINNISVHIIQVSGVIKGSFHSKTPTSHFKVSSFFKDDFSFLSCLMLPQVIISGGVELTTVKV